MSRKLFLILVLVAVAARELVIWFGYSWVAATVVAVVMVLGAFVFLDRRLPKH